MNVLSHLAETLAELLRDDERRVLLGEDVLDGGMLGLSRLVVGDAELRPRVVPTPLAPSAVFAHAAGLAVGGRRPIVVLASTTAVVEGLAGLREAALLGWRTAGAHAASILIVAPCGPGFSLGGDAADGVEGLLASIAGVRVMMAGRAEDAGAWLRAAADDTAHDGPTVLLLPRSLLLRELLAPAREAIDGAPHVAREGRAVTVFAWGPTLEPALAATELAEVDARVVEIGCLAPLARDALAAHARATGKIVIASVGGGARSIAGDLAALCADEAILHLDAPVTCVAGSSGPAAAHDEHAAIPSVDRIAEAIRAVADY